MVVHLVFSFPTPISQCWGHSLRLLKTWFRLTLHGEGFHKIMVRWWYIWSFLPHPYQSMLGTQLRLLKTWFRLTLHGEGFHKGYGQMVIHLVFPSPPLSVNVGTQLRPLKTWFRSTLHGEGFHKGYGQMVIHLVFPSPPLLVNVGDTVKAAEDLIQVNIAWGRLSQGLWSDGDTFGLSFPTPISPMLGTQLRLLKTWFRSTLHGEGFHKGYGQMVIHLVFPSPPLSVNVGDTVKAAEDLI